MQRLSVTKHNATPRGFTKRNKPAANANPANRGSPWRSLGYDPGNEAAYDPAPRTVCASVQTFAPADYLAYELRASRPLPKRWPSRAERDHPDWPAQRLV